MIVEFKFPSDDALKDELEGAGLDVLPYNVRYGSFRLRIGKGDVESQRLSIQPLIARARDAYRL